MDQNVSNSSKLCCWPQARHSPIFVTSIYFLLLSMLKFWPLLKEAGESFRKFHKLKCYKFCFNTAISQNRWFGIPPPHSWVFWRSLNRWKMYAAFFHVFSIMWKMYVMLVHPKTCLIWFLLLICKKMYLCT